MNKNIEISDANKYIKFQNLSDEMHALNNNYTCDIEGGFYKEFYDLLDCMCNVTLDFVDINTQDANNVVLFSI